ncbi:MAG TPA: dipeptidase [Terriglobia bacterium]|nr:dipeptidase [Terriglobia bacterium]
MPNLRRGVFVMLMLFLSAPLPRAAGRTPEEAGKVAQRVLERAIVIDLHSDTTQMMLDEGYDLAEPDSLFMVSIPKMRQGHLGAAFFSVWVSVDWPKGNIVQRALDEIDVIHEQVARHSDALGLASTADDIVRLHGQNKIAILMGLEGGHAIRNDLRLLDIYYRLGARYMTLTHTAHTDWAESSGQRARGRGLSDLGRQVVGRMNRLGMMVDISHVSDKTFFDTLSATKAPVIASHSSCRALCAQPRNMTDEMIRALAKNGGVMYINFYSAFLDPTYAAAQKKVSAKRKAEFAAVSKRFAHDRKRLAEELRRIYARYEAALPTPSFERIADHIDHAVRVGGIDHVGLGSDFDGIDSAPRGMEDVSKLPNLVRELARRGYSEEDLEKILGGNTLRVMRQVEDAAGKLQAGE